MEEKNKSVGWVVGMLALLVTYFGWAFLAADYFQHGQPDAASETDFWVNSVEQLPNVVSVISHGFQNRLWLIGLIIVCEIFVVVLWIVLKKLEKELQKK